MLTKNCKLVLDSVLSLDQTDWYKAFSMGDLVKLSGLSMNEIKSVIESLDQLGFAQITYLNLPNYLPAIDTIHLTERGIHYKDLQREEKLNYFKDKWIDFLALVVALIALLKSFEPEILALLQK
ncbi:hypothetical protein [Muriventricola aceti]|uniref:hypothetical protein n=1 Tax=Muriventricola aceti TaxID=2981773 RepID=UPI003EBE622C